MSSSSSAKQQQQQQPAASLPPPTCYWLPATTRRTKDAQVDVDDDSIGDFDLVSVVDADCLCLGTGRFLRSVLIPILLHEGVIRKPPLFVQPRGTSFAEHMRQLDRERLQRSETDVDDVDRQPFPIPNSYPVDTVLQGGTVRTDWYPCGGAFSMQDRQFVLYRLIPHLQRVPRVVGVGVTEAGILARDSQAMVDLYDVLVALRDLLTAVKAKLKLKEEVTPSPTTANIIHVVNTDNVPNNGTTIRSRMLEFASSDARDGTDAREDDIDEDANKTADRIGEDYGTAAASNDDDDTTIGMVRFLKDCVVFHDTMVDRIVSHRSGDDKNVPRCEPFPSKSLVVLDEATTTTTTTTKDPNYRLLLQPKEMGASDRDGDTSTTTSTGSLIVRTSRKQLDTDLALKLRVCNGTHTAIAHVLALLGVPETTFLGKITSTIKSKPQSGVRQEQQSSPNDDGTGTDTASSAAASLLLLEYLDQWVEHQVVPGASANLVSRIATTNDQTNKKKKNDDGNDGNDDLEEEEDEADAKNAVRETYRDWRRRLTHPYFGLSTFFITQNGAQKGGIRFGPTVTDLISANSGGGGGGGTRITVATAFAYAALLRFLTPCRSHHRNEGGEILRGWLQQLRQREPPSKDDSASRDGDGGDDVPYADGLAYNLKRGYYEFRCTCRVTSDGDNGRQRQRNLSEWLSQVAWGGNRDSDGSKSGESSEREYPQPEAYYDVVRSYLISPEGGNLLGDSITAEDDAEDHHDRCLSRQRRQRLDTLAKAVSTLLARMVAGDDLIDMLRELRNNDERQGSYAEDGYATDCAVLVDGEDDGEGLIDRGGRPLPYRKSPIPDGSALLKARVSNACIRSVVVSEVASVEVVDLHTHLLPPSHGASMCLWGADELLTYVSNNIRTCANVQRMWSSCSVRARAEGSHCRSSIGLYGATSS